MVPGNTTTAKVLEEMVLPALARGGYTFQTQVNVGSRLGGGRHYVDVVAKDPEGNAVLISLKWQQVGGTAEQKVPFEIMCLTHAVLDPANDFHKAYIVLGGNGWKLKDFYANGGLNPYLRYPATVRLMLLEDFIAAANKAQL
jgi:hypothetical protein